MRLTVLGGGGAWPVLGRGCSGYVVASGDTVVLVDPGPGTCGELLARWTPHQVSAVLISHGHADHVSDLPSLLRARRMADPPASALPVFAPAGALEGVLSLDVAKFVAPSVLVHEVGDGDLASIGPIHVAWRRLPHHVHNLGIRLLADGATLVYTGDTGRSDTLDVFAAGADVLLADATYPNAVPEEDWGLLGSASDAGATASKAAVGRLVVTHLWPGTDPATAVKQASVHFRGPVDAALPGWELEVASSSR